MEIITAQQIFREITKLFGLYWQGASSKDVLGEYQVQFSGEQRLTSAHASTHELD